MVVPSTPLHTTRVLTEDRALWEDVKVRTTPALTLSGQTLALQPGAMALQVGLAQFFHNAVPLRPSKCFAH